MKHQKRLLVILGIFTLLIIAALPAHAATHRYDALGRLVETSYGSGATVTYTYDANGNMTVVTGVASEHDTFMLTLSAEEGGTIAEGESGDYFSGNKISISACPDEGYMFTGWTATEGVFDNANSATTVFTMPANDVAVVANFEKIPDEPESFKLEILADVGGAISVGESGEYNHGQEIDIAAIPDDGYAFSGWTTTNGGTFDNARQASATFTMPDNDTNVIAHFEPIITNTHSVTGQVRSYNPGNPTAVRLMQGGEKVYAATIAAEIGGYGQVTQGFAFEGVAPGAYWLVVTKPGHTSFTVQAVAVGDEDVDLADDSRPEVRLMTLPCGDVNGDGMINSADLAVLWRSDNFNKSAAQAAEPLCDLDGDGMINSADLAILWLATNFNKGAVSVP